MIRIRIRSVESIFLWSIEEDDKCLANGSQGTAETAHAYAIGTLLTILGEYGWNKWMDEYGRDLM